MVSDAIKLLDLVWHNANDGTSHSWERLNHAMLAALRLAVGSGFKFTLTDVKHVFENYRSERWIGDWETIYSIGVAVENMPFVTSYELYRKRMPFIADDVTMEDRSGYAHTGGHITRAKCRLTVGSTFQWKGVKVKVTSFSSDNSYLNACSYKPRTPDGYESSKIDKRFKIAREDIIAERAERKEQKKLAKSA